MAKGRLNAAVKRASGQRLLADFRLARWIIESAETEDTREAEWFTRGAIAAEGSLTVKACLATAFGG